MDSTFEAYRPANRNQRHALEQVRDFPLMYSTGQRQGYLLWGPVGTGKTHLMVALFRVMTLSYGVPCVFVDFGQLDQIGQDPLDRDADHAVLFPQFGLVERRFQLDADLRRIVGQRVEGQRLVGLAYNAESRAILTQGGGVKPAPFEGDSKDRSGFLFPGDVHG